MSRSWIGLILALIIAGHGCDGSVPTPPQHSPTEMGPIVARDLQFGGMHGTRNIHVRPEGAMCGTVLSIDSRTTITARLPDGRLERRDPWDLEIGRRVRAWASGSVADSCPGQGNAGYIEIIG